MRLGSGLLAPCLAIAVSSGTAWAQSNDWFDLPDPSAFVAEEAPLHRTLAGVEVAMPEIAGLDCEEISAVLRRIDESRYRGPAPLGASHPDRLLFEYEDALTRASFDRCASGTGGSVQTPTSAFQSGFETN